jgi:hypothetical protein
MRSVLYSLALLSMLSYAALALGPVESQLCTTHKSPRFGSKAFRTAGVPTLRSVGRYRPGWYPTGRAGPGTRGVVSSVRFHFVR